MKERNVDYISKEMIVDFILWKFFNLTYVNHIICPIHCGFIFILSKTLRHGGRMGCMYITHTNTRTLAPSSFIAKFCKHSDILIHPVQHAMCMWYIIIFDDANEVASISLRCVSAIKWWRHLGLCWWHNIFPWLISFCEQYAIVWIRVQWLID